MEPVPPERVGVNVTEFPTSVGFWELASVTEGFELIVTVTEEDEDCPTLSVIVTVRVYDPDEEKEYEKSCDVLT